MLLGNHLSVLGNLCERERERERVCVFVCVFVLF